MRRVVVTGMGVISPIGNSVEEMWESARNGRSGIDHWHSEQSIPENINPISGQVKNFDPVEYYGKREARRMDRATHFTLYVAKQALEDSGLQITPENQYDIACIIGTGIGGIESLRDTVLSYNERGYHGVSPTVVPLLLHDNIPARVTMEYDIRGANYSVVSACATGNNAIGEALDMIRLGRAKAVLAGATEAAFVNVVMAGFNNMKTLSQYEGEPQKAARPFDANRDGFVAGEGAAMLIMEDLEHALARGARIYGEIKGYGHTSDAYHVTAPRDDGTAAAKAIEFALRDAGLKKEDIQYINAHGTGTVLNDLSETLAIKLAFGEEAYNIPVSSTKSMTGHMLGATAVLEAIIGLMAIRDNYVPPTINYETPDPQCDLDYVPNVGRAVKVDNVLSNAFGFGGHNATVIVSRYEG